MAKGLLPVIKWMAIKSLTDWIMFSSQLDIWSLFRCRRFVFKRLKLMTILHHQKHNSIVFPIGLNSQLEK